MATESMFLREIAARPDDLTARLVYADWLEEFGGRLAKLRAEQLRLEAEASTLPAWADRFWEIKQRRKELRLRADAGWLAAMGYDEPFKLCFAHGIPERWEDRWRLTRAFTEVWYDRRMPDIGGRADHIAEVEAQLGRTLAPSVREWVAFAKDVEVEGYPGMLFYTQSGYEIDIGRLPGFDGYTVARCDYESGSTHILVDAPDPDPALTEVASLIDESTEEPTRHYTEGAPCQSGDRVSTFALGQAVTWVRGVRDCYAHVSGEEAPAVLARMQTEFPTHVNLNKTNVFEAPELLVTTYASSYPGPGLGLHAIVRRPSQEVWQAFPPVFRELVTAVAKREGRSSTSDAAGFLLYFDPKEYRPPKPEPVVLVDE